jgi:hypothetical protein
VSTLAIAAAEPSTIELSALTRDPELACRAAGVSKGTVAEYAEAMKAGAVFPPVVVFVDQKGAHWLADGFHRCAGAELAGLAEVTADVRQGSRKDALLYAASANSSHGLRRTNADKRRAVLLVLGNFPKWSDRKIGEACGVDHKTVAAARVSLATEPTTGGEIPQDEGGTPEQPAPADMDATVERLSKALQRLLAQWPTERRDELRALLSGARRAAGEPVAATAPRPDPRREPDWEALPGGERVQVARVELKKTGGAA